VSRAFVEADIVAGIIRSFLLISFLVLNGIVNARSSKKVMPIDQTSNFAVYY
jgi:hypothetical protein